MAISVPRYHGKDDGEEGDDERIAQALQQILITVVIDEAGFELIYHSRLIAGSFHISGIHHDDLSHIGVGIREIRYSSPVQESP